MSSAFAVMLTLARGVNYVRERRRPSPRTRSWARRASIAPRKNRARVHHFVPGIGIAFAAGGTGILMLPDRRATWLSWPFGAGAALALDEIELLLALDNPYWGSQTVTAAQGTLATLTAATLAGRFHRRGGCPS